LTVVALFITRGEKRAQNECPLTINGLQSIISRQNIIKVSLSFEVPSNEAKLEVKFDGKKHTTQQAKNANAACGVGHRGTRRWKMRLTTQAIATFSVRFFVKIFPGMLKAVQLLPL